MGSQGAPVFILKFSGHFERDGQYVYAICDQVPLAVPGETEQDARDAMDAALELYLNTLDQRDELGAALQEFNVTVIQLPTFQPLSRLPGPSEGSFEMLVPAGHAP